MTNNYLAFGVNLISYIPITKTLNIVYFLKYMIVVGTIA